VMKIDVRRQDDKNRQNSIPDISEETREWFEEENNKLNEIGNGLEDIMFMTEQDDGGDEGGDEEKRFYDKENF